MRRNANSKVNCCVLTKLTSCDLSIWHIAYPDPLFTVSMKACSSPIFGQYQYYWAVVRLCHEEIGSIFGIFTAVGFLLLPPTCFRPRTYWRGYGWSDLLSPTYMQMRRRFRSRFYIFAPWRQKSCIAIQLKQIGTWFLFNGSLIRLLFLQHVLQSFFVCQFDIIIIIIININYVRVSLAKYLLHFVVRVGKSDVKCK